MYLLHTHTIRISIVCKFHNVIMKFANVRSDRSLWKIHLVVKWSESLKKQSSVWSCVYFCAFFLRVFCVLCGGILRVFCMFSACSLCPVCLFPACFLQKSRVFPAFCVCVGPECLLCASCVSAFCMSAFSGSDWEVCLEVKGGLRI